MKREKFTHRIAVFISSHGFGHAARSCAIMSALHDLDFSICFEIFTKVPARFFQDSLSGPFTFHTLQNDVGIVQKTPFREDLDSTIERLNAFLPFDKNLISGLARQIKEQGCELLICDIAPMGLSVAMEAEIPSILIENFTWDWIYEEYANKNRQVEKHIKYLRNIFKKANYRIQTEPVCQRCKADLITESVGRKVKMPAELVRRQLNIPNEFKIIMITTGGVPNRYDDVRNLRKYHQFYFVIPGASRRVTIQNNLRLLPYFSEFYHPDLINASDAVIGKAGYSTIAEIYHAGIPFGYISRPTFRESAKLTDFIKENMSGISIPAAEFHNGRWMDKIPDIMALPGFKPNTTNGANQIADFIFNLLE